MFFFARNTAIRIRIVNLRGSFVFFAFFFFLSNIVSASRSHRNFNIGNDRARSPQTDNVDDYSVFVRLPLQRGKENEKYANFRIPDYRCENSRAKDGIVWLSLLQIIFYIYINMCVLLLRVSIREDEISLWPSIVKPRDRGFADSPARHIIIIIVHLLYR